MEGRRLREKDRDLGPRPRPWRPVDPQEKNSLSVCNLGRLPLDWKHSSNAWFRMNCHESLSGVGILLINMETLAAEQWAVFGVLTGGRPQGICVLSETSPRLCCSRLLGQSLAELVLGWYFARNVCLTSDGQVEESD